MSFKMSEFLLENLRNGYINKSFTKEQVNIFAVGYMMKGMISQDEFNGLLAWVESYVFEEDLPKNDEDLDPDFSVNTPIETENED